MSLSPNRNMIPIASISITDTTTHTYRTDAWNGSTGIRLYDLSGFYLDEPDAILLFVNNGENQALTVQLSGNVDSTKSYEDYLIGPSSSVSSASSSGLYYYPKGSFAQDAWPAEYIALQLSFATAPSSGSVTALMRLYYFGD